MSALTVETGELVRATTIGANPIAAALTASLSETAALAILRNMSGLNDALERNPSGPIVLPKYLRLTCRVAPASATTAELQIAVDDIDRYSSGGSNIDGVTANTSKGFMLSDRLAQTVAGRLDFGAVVANAAGARRRMVARALIKNAILAVGDEIIITFGETLGDTPQLKTGASSQVIPVSVGAVALAPNKHSLVVHIWYASVAVTPAQFDVEASWRETL